MWAPTDTAADLAPLGPNLWAATAGGLVQVVDGKASEQVRSPEIAWRAIAIVGDSVAAVGARNVTWKAGGAWRSEALPSGIEGHSIASDGKGWWVGTSAGVIRLNSSSGLLERRDFGPVRRIASDGVEVWALGEERFHHLPSVDTQPPPRSSGPWVGCVRSGRLVVAGAGGDQPLAVWEWSGMWRQLPGIPGTGSHITAMAAGSNSLMVAVAQDGLWQLSGKRWTRITAAPDALSSDAATIRPIKGGLLGAARSGGVWRLSSHKWERISLGSDLPTANIQAMADYQGVVYASTFDRGLLRLEGEAWKPVGGADGPKSPRQLAVCDGLLFVRETDGTLSSFDGAAWERNLLRHQVRRPWIGGICATPFGLALGGNGVVITGLPGAWKESVLPTPWKGVTASCVGWTGHEVAMGTGKDGLLLVNPETGATRVAPGGSADTWVTALLEQNGEITAGTAGGRIADARQGSHELVVGAPVTGLTTFSGWGSVAATRDGLYVREADSWVRLACPEADSLEPQCLLATSNALWVGGRHGILKMSRPRS